MMKSLYVVTAALSLVFASSNFASAAETGWAIRFHGLFVNSSASYEQVIPGEGLFEGEAGSGLGIDLAGEYRFDNVVGIEGSLLWASIDADFLLDDGVERFTDSDDLRMGSLGLALNLHLTSGHRVDVWVAPGVNWIDFSDMHVEHPRLGRDVLTTGSDFAPSVALGVDIPFGERGWAFSTGVQYMWAESKETDNPPAIPPIRVDVDPLFVQIGLAYRF
jgi:outer membrane protein W